MRTCLDEIASPPGWTDGDPLAGPIERRIALSRAAFAWERVWPALWPALGILGLFVALALFELWPSLPLWAHTAALYATVGGTVIALLKGFWTVRLPTRDEAIRRLERTNGLPHRPLTALTDRPAAPDAEAAALWSLHRTRMRAALSRLSVVLPRALMSERDPNALRILVLLGVIAGLMAAGADAPRRLLASLSLERPGPPVAPPRLDAWITPPAYTERPPVFLPRDLGTAAAVSVPEGSVLVLRVQGLAHAPQLGIARDPAAAAETPAAPDLALKPLGDGIFEATGPLMASQTVTLTDGLDRLAEWRITVQPDATPEIAFAAVPSVSHRLALVLGYTASDDYGLTGVELEIILDRTAMAASGLEVDVAPGEGTFSFALPVPAADAEKATRASKDLTSHPWAGLPVLLTLTANDAAGQQGRSVSLAFVLPERQFRNPLARALIEQRKALILSHANAERVARMLEALTLAPERFFEDATLYLGIRAAARRLRIYAAPELAEAREETLQGVEELLYALALRAEDGGLTLAEQALREAMRALAEALENGASDAEIERRMAELKAALSEFLRELAENGPRPGETAEGARSLSPEDLARMLEAIEDMSRQGARQAARDMLSELQGLLENLQMGEAPAMSLQERAMGEALQGLGDLIARQRGLMDETFQEQMRQEDPRAGDGRRREGERLSEEQQALQDDLDALREKLELGGGGAGAEGLDGAGESMGEARKDLDGQGFGAAVEDQQRAIDQMRRGAEQLARQLMQGRGEQPGQAGAGGPGGRGRGNDPFGRGQGNGNAMNGDDVRVPEERDLQRARDLLEELQRRSGDRSRPPLELDYIDRLLRRF